PKILLIGQIGAGKSSFFNSVKSIFRGHVTLQLFCSHLILSSLPFVLCDTMGLEQEKNDEGIHKDDIISVIKGHVPDLYEFNPKAPITRNDRRYREDPSPADKVHCVVYVVEADKITFMDQNLLKKFKTIRSEVNKMGIPQLVLVTKIDNIFQEVNEDLTKVYWSKCLHEKVSVLGDMLEVPDSDIFPVKNYSTETELDVNMDILLLGALQQMMRTADACFVDMS
uniref:G domain-containing protein n=1 Tax=Erpetoichthys calabaricus TaxID=27687 RepID=A0A8C4SXF0_ERPCA